MAVERFTPPVTPVPTCCSQRARHACVRTKGKVLQQGGALDGVGWTLLSCIPPEAAPKTSEAAQTAVPIWNSVGTRVPT